MHTRPTLDVCPQLGVLHVDGPIGDFDMSEQQIALKSVNELRVSESGECVRYFIPDYQRGFRWSPLQVRQLVDDIREFTQRRNPQPEEFYCLQPLVIKSH